MMLRSLWGNRWRTLDHNSPGTPLLLTIMLSLAVARLWLTANAWISSSMSSAASVPHSLSFEGYFRVGSGLVKYLSTLSGT